MHSDVLATPEDQLVMALDWVKTHELNGHPYSLPDYGKMSLGLKKFLTCSKDEQLRAVQEERKRLEEEKEQADRTARQRVTEIATIQNAYDQSEREKTEIASRLTKLQDTTVSIAVLKQIGYSVLRIAAAISLGFFRTSIVGLVPVKLATLARLLQICLDAVVVGAALWGILGILAKIPMRERTRRIVLAGGSVVVVLGYGIFQGYEPGTINETLDLAFRFGAAVCLLIPQWRKHADQNAEQR